MSSDASKIKTTDQVIRSGIAGGVAGCVVCNSLLPTATGPADITALHLPRQRRSLRRSTVSRSSFRPRILNIRNMRVRPVLSCVAFPSHSAAHPPTSVQRHMEWCFPRWIANIQGFWGVRTLSRSFGDSLAYLPLRSRQIHGI